MENLITQGPGMGVGRQAEGRRCSRSLGLGLVGWGPDVAWSSQLSGALVKKNVSKTLLKGLAFLLPDTTRSAVARSHSNTPPSIPSSSISTWA